MKMICLAKPYQCPFNFRRSTIHPFLFLLVKCYRPNNWKNLSPLLPICRTSKFFLMVIYYCIPLKEIETGNLLDKSVLNVMLTPTTIVFLVPRIGTVRSPTYATQIKEAKWGLQKTFAPLFYIFYLTGINSRIIQF